MVRLSLLFFVLVAVSGIALAEPMPEQPGMTLVRRDHQSRPPRGVSPGTSHAKNRKDDVADCIKQAKNDAQIKVCKMGKNLGDDKTDCRAKARTQAEKDACKKGKNLRDDEHDRCMAKARNPAQKEACRQKGSRLQRRQIPTQGGNEIPGRLSTKGKTPPNTPVKDKTTLVTGRRPENRRDDIPDCLRQAKTQVERDACKQGKNKMDDKHDCLHDAKTQAERDACKKGKNLRDNKPDCLAQARTQSEKDACNKGKNMADDKHDRCMANAKTDAEKAKCPTLRNPATKGSPSANGSLTANGSPTTNGTRAATKSP